MQQVAKEVGRDLRGTSLNLDGVSASTHQRPCMFKAGLLPNIQENPRYRKLTKYWPRELRSEFHWL